MRSPRNCIIPLVIIVALGLNCACKSKTDQAAAQPAGPPPTPVMPVTVASVLLQTVPLQVRVVGTVEPSEKVEIKSTIAGEITAVKFTEGQEIHQGDLLFEIDSRPYVAALRQAEATVLRDRAMLSQSQAMLQKDTVTSQAAAEDAKRYDSLLKDRLVSQQQHLQYSSAADSAKETVSADNAGIESAKATLDLDQVAVDKAKLDLSYCQIKSPISGRAGSILVHQGNLVKTNDVALVVVNRITPVFVSFNAPDKYLDAIRKFSAAGKLPVQALSHEDRHSRRDRHALAHRQHSRYSNRHHPSESDFRKFAPDSLAWPVCRRCADALGQSGSHGNPRSGGAAWSKRPVCLRRQNR